MVVSLMMALCGQEERIIWARRCGYGSKGNKQKKQVRKRPLLPTRPPRTAYRYCEIQK
eukprot:COSAG06_NODE_2839_length_6196_cov_2.423487_7_plen_58_part_00